MLRLITYVCKIFTLILLVGACKKKAVTLPIEEEKLVRIVADVQVAEAVLQNSYGRLKDSMGNRYLSQILQIHGVDSIAFVQCMDYLLKDPAAMESLFGKVIETLEKDELKLVEENPH